MWPDTENRISWKYTKILYCCPKHSAWVCWAATTISVHVCISVPVIISYAITAFWLGVSGPAIALFARPPTPDQSVYHACTQVWKTPPFCGFWTKKTPLFQLKSLILRSNKTPFINAKYDFIFVKYHFWESEINCIKYFLCKSYFSLRLIWNECLTIRLRSKVWKTGWKQATTCKIFTLCFKFRKCMAEKLPFLGFANSRLP